MRGALYVALAIVLAGCTVPDGAPPTPEAQTGNGSHVDPTREPAPVAPNPDVALPTPEESAPRTPTSPAPEPTPAIPQPPPPAGEPPAPSPEPTPPLSPIPSPSPTPAATATGGTTPGGTTSGAPSGGTASSPPPTPAPFTIQPGSDAAGGSFLRSWSRDADGRGFAADMRAVPGATLQIDSLARVVVGAAAVAVRLEAPPVSDAGVHEARLIVRQGATDVAVLDLLQPDPAVETSLASGATYDVAWRYTLAPDAVAPVSVALRIGS